MEKFLLKRITMATLLLALKNGGPVSPTVILQEAYSQESSLEYINTALIPPIFEKILKIKEVDPGFSLNDIVALGNQIQYTKFSNTAVQNWVKRDVKEILGVPQKGRKYSIDQMILLFIVEDLKAILDFDSIRKCLNFMFNDPAKRNDDLIDPVKFYFLYASIFEELQHLKSDLPIEVLIEKKAENSISTLDHLLPEQRKMIRHYLAVASLSVHVAYIETIAKRFYNATLFFVNS